MVVRVCGLTDRGMRRELNEDSFKMCGFEDGKALGVCVLADGMGGHNAGEVASAAAVEIITDDLKDRMDEADDKQVTLNIAGAIDFANSHIHEKSLKNHEQAGMGTTVVVAYVRDSQIRVANIGDSCAYVVSDKEICKITVDHSVVEELVRRGTITREEARSHPDKNIITRAVGTEAYVDADFFDYTAMPGDTIILCSDGLTEMVRDEEIKEIITKAENTEEAVKTLVDEANKNGGVDNITVVALHFEEEENI